MSEISLREVCEIYNVSRRAVQGYEKAGLVSPTGKNKYGYLLYDDAARKRIAKIKQYRDMGFQLKEIKELIDAPNEILKGALLQRKEGLEHEIKHAKNMLKLIQKIILEL